MKKLFKGIIGIGLCAAMAFGIVGCSNKDKKDPEKPSTRVNDPETRALKLAIGAVDQKFNPLFYTAQNDGEIANMTQVSMLQTDKEGRLAYGDDYPTVTLDYLETYYDVGGNVLGTSTGDGQVSGNSGAADHTTYEFVIKNGMKFSDGAHDLTVMDVLFNLYVYLDPVYTGSATIYSTKIRGLQAYRQQKANAGEDSSLDTQKYYQAAEQRIKNLRDWGFDNGSASTPDNAALKADLEVVKKYFLEELTTDYNSVETSWVESHGAESDNYNLKSAWQTFYFTEGLAEKQTEQQSDGSVKELTTIIDGKEKFLTDFDADKDGKVKAEHLIKDIEDYVKENLSTYMAANSELTKEEATLALEKERAIKHVYDSFTSNGANIYKVLTYFSTGNTVLEYFALEAMTEESNNQSMLIPSISGIAVKKANTFNGKALDGDHDVLSITINGVDPKAKWNFSFTVAPMYYYSDEAHYNAAMADYNSGKVYNGTATNFGVKYKDIIWFNNVLGASEKTALPVGAGVYKATSNSAYRNKKDAGVPGKDFDGGDFFFNNVAYFERNTSFHTMGKNLNDANIKYVTYEVMGNDKIVAALKVGKIDYGMPSATSINQTEISGEKNLESATSKTGGYGYVGINPYAVPDLEVRQAIMHALDTSAISVYFGSKSLYTVINRPMSDTSWAYPQPENKVERYYDQWTEANKDDIQKLVLSSNKWTLNNKGKFVNGNNEPLKITFTIAGETTDHPSYMMFKNAEKLLNECGFEIKAVTDIQALQKLASGKLEVWAAAWSSSIDPDPYQIYSIYSNASSTKNWYKDGILSNFNDFYREYAIAQVLADKIDEGRQTLSQAERIAIYGGTASTFNQTLAGGAYKTADDHKNISYSYEALSELPTLNLVMEMAVEFPTYQRNDMYVWNTSILDKTTIYVSSSDKAYLYTSPIGELWKLNYV